MGARFPFYTWCLIVSVGSRSQEAITLESACISSRGHTHSMLRGFLSESKGLFGDLLGACGVDHSWCYVGFVNNGL
jgi:hypothetical protein